MRPGKWRVDSTRRSAALGDSPGGTYPEHEQRLDFSEPSRTEQDAGARCDAAVCEHRTHIPVPGNDMQCHCQSMSAPADSQKMK
jgi:hypothetical protein